MKKIKNFLLFLIVYIIISAVTYGGGLSAYKQKHQPTFSVVMTTYNRAAQLPRVIASVLNQTYQDFEFVILDDGSTDSTQEILSFWQARDSRIRLIKNDRNRGIPYSRNRLIKEAGGKFVTIIDSDDIMYQNLLQDVSNYITENSDIDIIYGNHLISWDEEGCVHSVQNKWPIHILEDNIMQNSGVTYRRSFVKRHHILYNETFSVTEDYDFWLQMIMKGAKVGYIEKDFVCYEWLPKQNEDYVDNMASFRFGALKKLYRFLGLDSTHILPMCETARKFQEKNLPFLSKGEWDREFYLNCPILPQETEIKLRHKNWNGRAAVNEAKTRVRRLGITDESGSIVSYSPDKITVKWDKWGKETFIRQEDGVFEVQ